MTDPTLSEIIARLEVIEAQQQEILRLLRHGVNPPEWVSGKALALSLGIKPRSVEFYRYNCTVTLYLSWRHISVVKEEKLDSDCFSALSQLGSADG